MKRLKTYKFSSFLVEMLSKMPQLQAPYGLEESVSIAQIEINACRTHLCHHSECGQTVLQNDKIKQ